MGKFINLIGQRFGELTVVRLAEARIKNRPAWQCLCDCGQLRVASSESLRGGEAKSCGKHSTKAFREAMLASNQRKRLYPAGTDTKSRIYTLWRAMIYRCTNPAHEAYSRYGGAGISICAEWMSFSGFRVWALGSGYAPHLTIDRIDNAGNYEPKNCRWASPIEQARNRKSGLVSLQAFGEEKPLVEWVEDPRCAVHLAVLRKRLAAKYKPEDAISTPLRITRKTPTRTSPRICNG